MSEIEPKISICIPTYNRSSYLKKSIDSLICQKEFYPSNVEIIISDNNSTDDTAELISKYTEKYKNIYYFKNNENIKDKNYPLVFSRAHGLFRKLCNDTLIYKEGTLKYLLDLVDSNKFQKPCIFFMNGSTTKYNKTQEYKNVSTLEEFIYSTSFYITWIAGMSLWDDDCIDIENKVDGCDLLLWQVKFILENVVKKQNALIINKSLFNVQTVEKKDISYGLFNVFYENLLYKLIKPYVQTITITNQCFTWIEKDLLFHFFTNWLIQYELENKKFNYSKTENLKQIVFMKYKNKSYYKLYLLYYKYHFTRRILIGIIKKIKNT